MTIRNKSNPAKPCICDLCHQYAVSISGTRHRRCGGKRDARPLAKHAPWAKVAGRWQ